MTSDIDVHVTMVHIQHCMVAGCGHRTIVPCAESVEGMININENNPPV